MPATAAWHAATIQTEVAASMDSMPLVASERCSAAVVTWWQLVRPAAAHETEESREGLLSGGRTGAPRGPLTPTDLPRRGVTPARRKSILLLYSQR